MFGKGKQRDIPTKQAKKATLILFQAVSINYDKVTNDIIKEDTKTIKQFREYTIDILKKSELALLALNDELITRGEIKIGETDNE